MEEPIRLEDYYQARQQLPPWRKAWGLNQWNEEMVQGILRWLKRTFPKATYTRADAVAYIAKRDRPSHPEYSVLLARCEEIQVELDAVADVGAIAPASSEPELTPEQKRDRFAQLKAKMQNNQP